MRGLTVTLVAPDQVPQENRLGAEAGRRLRPGARRNRRHAAQRDRLRRRTQHEGLSHRRRGRHVAVEHWHDAVDHDDGLTVWYEADGRPAPVVTARPED
jgi:hypothetical protein